MTAAKVDVDLADIESLEFQPPCEITTNIGSVRVPCERAAEWIFTYQRHCGGGIRVRLICTSDLHYFMDGGPSRCVLCGAITTVTDRIISTERIAS